MCVYFTRKFDYSACTKIYFNFQHYPLTHFKNIKYFNTLNMSISSFIWKLMLFESQDTDEKKKFLCKVIKM